METMIKLPVGMKMTTDFEVVETGTHKILCTKSEEIKRLQTTIRYAVNQLIASNSVNAYIALAEVLDDAGE